MGILVKNSKAAPATSAEKKSSVIGKKGSASTAKATPAKAATKAAWYKRGDDTAGALEQEEQAIKVKKSQQGKMWRFYLEDGQKAQITFVDGNLTDKGNLDIIMYREHQIFRNGKWTNWYTCTGENEPCPICESGDQASLVGALTIIDHREYQGKKKVYKDTPRLFVAKLGTLKILTQMAVKRGGLAGCTFEVSRQGDQSPNVGNVFDFEEKNEIEDLRAAFVHEGEDGKMVSFFVPANYEDELPYLTAKELRAAGFGGGTPVGGEAPLHDASPADKSVDEALG
jgi:hypothetical protein